MTIDITSLISGLAIGFCLGVIFSLLFKEYKGSKEENSKVQEQNQSDDHQQEESVLNNHLTSIPAEPPKAEEKEDLE